MPAAHVPARVPAELPPLMSNADMAFGNDDIPLPLHFLLP